MDKRVKSRLTLIGLVMIFALPALIAQLVLTQNWYQAGVTNTGELIEGNVTLSSLGIESSHLNEGWILGYVVPDNCNERCMEQVHLLGQSYIALGRYKERVTPALFSTTASDIDSLPTFASDTISIAQSHFRDLPEASIVIIDPRGQLVMRYISSGDDGDLVSQSQGMLHDLRKLLKLSRVG